MALGLLVAPAAALAVVAGELDEFSPGTEQWQRGAIALGGPANPNDPFLLLTADGVSMGGRIVSFNQTQWAGDYAAAGVGQISMWVNNLGATNLDLRVAIGDSTAPNLGGSWYASTTPEVLPAGSGWKEIVFGLGAGDLSLVSGSAAYADVIDSVVTLRILHATIPLAMGTPVVATLGVDRIVAVPEPGATAQGACALLALALCSRSRRTRRA